MRTHIPNLNSIVFSGKSWADGDMASILVGSRSGWRDVQVERGTWFGTQAKDALMENLGTLERLALYGENGFKSDKVIQVLNSSPELHTLHYDVRTLGTLPSLLNKRDGLARPIKHNFVSLTLYRPIQHYNPPFQSLISVMVAPHMTLMGVVLLH